MYLINLGHLHFTGVKRYHYREWNPTIKSFFIGNLHPPSEK